MLGYYYSNIEFGDDQDKITLSDIQNYGTPTTNDLSTIIAQYPENSIISLVNNSKYPNCSKIISIEGNTITVEKLPFNNVEIVEDLAMDDYSLWVESSPKIGIVSLGYYAHSEGENSKALERASHAEGRETLAYGQYSHAEGRNTKANYSAHAEGQDTNASGQHSHSEGRKTLASATASHAEGYLSIASANYSHSEGNSSVASGVASHAEGNASKALDLAAHSEGFKSEAHKLSSHSEGYETKAYGEYSHSEGYKTITSGTASHTEGHATEARGNRSHAEGYGTIANGLNQHVQGKFNIIDTENKYADIVGNGSKEDEYDEDGNLIKQNRSNAYTLDWNGNAEFAGSVKSNGKQLATEEFVNESIEETFDIQLSISESGECISSTVFADILSAYTEGKNIKLEVDIVIDDMPFKAYLNLSAINEYLAVFTLIDRVTSYTVYCYSEYLNRTRNWELIISNLDPSFDYYRVVVVLEEKDVYGNKVYNVINPSASFNEIFEAYMQNKRIELVALFDDSLLIFQPVAGNTSQIIFSRTAERNVITMIYCNSNNTWDFDYSVFEEKLNKVQKIPDIVNSSDEYPSVSAVKEYVYESIQSAIYDSWEAAI